MKPGEGCTWLSCQHSEIWKTVLYAVEPCKISDGCTDRLDGIFVSGLFAAVRSGQMFPFKIVGRRDDAPPALPAFPEGWFRISCLRSGIDQWLGSSGVVTLSLLKSPDHWKYRLLPFSIRSDDRCDISRFYFPFCDDRPAEKSAVQLL